jgi:hypothetical protein
MLVYARFLDLGPPTLVISRFLSAHFVSIIQSDMRKPVSGRVHDRYTAL